MTRFSDIRGTPCLNRGIRLNGLPRLGHPGRWHKGGGPVTNLESRRHGLGLRLKAILRTG